MTIDVRPALLAAYQGMSLLANALREPDIMTREGARLTRWIDSLTGEAGSSGAAEPRTVTRPAT